MQINLKNYVICHMFLQFLQSNNNDKFLNEYKTNTPRILMSFTRLQQNLNFFSRKFQTCPYFVVNAFTIFPLSVPFITILRKFIIFNSSSCYFNSLSVFQYSHSISIEVFRRGQRFSRCDEKFGVCRLPLQKIVKIIHLPLKGID